MDCARSRRTELALGALSTSSVKAIGAVCFKLVVPFVVEFGLKV